MPTNTATERNLENVVSPFVDFVTINATDRSENLYRYQLYIETDLCYEHNVLFQMVLKGRYS